MRIKIHSVIQSHKWLCNIAMILNHSQWAASESRHWLQPLNSYRSLVRPNLDWKCQRQLKSRYWWEQKLLQWGFTQRLTQTEGHWWDGTLCVNFGSNECNWANHKTLVNFAQKSCVNRGIWHRFQNFYNPTAPFALKNQTIHTIARADTGIQYFQM